MSRKYRYSLTSSVIFRNHQSRNICQHFFTCGTIVQTNTICEHHGEPCTSYYNMIEDNIVSENINVLLGHMFHGQNNVSLNDVDIFDI